MIKHRCMAGALALGLFQGAASLAARAEPGACKPLADELALIEQAHGATAPLDMRALDFARGVYVGLPPESTHLPQGDAALWVSVGDRRMILFLDGAQVCGAFAVPPGLYRMFGELGQRSGDPS